MKLTPHFYGRGARIVAQNLLGKTLVRVWEGMRVSGRIVETEAYCDRNEPDLGPDLACHGSKNNGRPTGRTAVMFGPPGYTYIYFNYGIHWLFNVVTGREGQANAVLIRALEPLEGGEIMQAHRPKQPRRQWTNGPAKLTKALALDKTFNGVNLYDPDGVIWIEDAAPIPTENIATGPRVGLGKNTPEPWLSIPWRYWIKENAFVSKAK